MKKNIIFVVISILILVSLGIGLSYSMWNMSLSQDTNNVIATTSECFDVTLTNQSNAIKLENAYPISDSKGKSLTPFTFTVKNTCDMFASYSVSLESLKGSTLSSEFLKVMVNDNEPKILNSLDSTDTVNSGSIESRILAKGSLSKNSSKDYSIRLWIDYDTTLEDLNNEIKILKSKIIIKAIPQGYNGETVFNFDYTGGEQTFTAPVTGTYKLETWGAQGGGSIGTYGYLGGFGAYSSGNVTINKNSILYLSIGGRGQSVSDTNNETISLGGYNGSGNGARGYNFKYYGGAGGGGATHIATKSGLLLTLENYKTDILIASGGGGGVSGNHWMAGDGGGFKGNNSQSVAAENNNVVYNWGGNSVGATQITGYAFGKGQDASDKKLGGGYGSEGNGGAGGGFYGGFTDLVKSGV